MELNIKLVDDSLAEFYSAKVANYSDDSGFDLYVADDQVISPHAVAFVDLKVVAEPLFTGGYYIYPRSSISKTPLRLANSVGVIDNGYRGPLIAALHNTSDSSYTIRRGERLVQVCHPSLQPLRVNIVPAVNMKTARGAGGFGSTSETQSQTQTQTQTQTQQ
jgi:dUTP pyrophosphatase